jgi:dolichyl-phosphate beta-glucosyltransferase
MITMSIIVPCYNEESRGNFEERLFSMKEDLEKLTISYELIFVNDGSLDKTLQVILDFIQKYELHDRWTAFDVEVNSGKGHAIATGITASRGKYVAYMDADLSVSADNFLGLQTELDENKCFIASRYLDTSKIVNKRPLLRRVLSKFQRSIISNLFGLHVTDTQCGFKIFPARQAKIALRQMINTRWLIDIEFLYAMKIQKVEIIEIPVYWDNMEENSSFKFNSGVFGSLSDLLSLLLHKSSYRRSIIKSIK